MAVGQRRLVYILETPAPGPPSYPRRPRRFLLLPISRIPALRQLEICKMRFEEQISGCLKSLVIGGAVVLLFGSGRVVSASGQAPAPAQTPSPSTSPAGSLAQQ